jgi:hypothetical protein
VRADIQALAAKPTAPELLQRQFSEITPRDHHYYVSGIERGRATFEVAQMWHAFAQSIRNGSAFAPGFREQLKMHYVWDATEKSIAERRWAKVDYSRLPRTPITRSRPIRSWPTRCPFHQPPRYEDIRRRSGNRRNTISWMSSASAAPPVHTIRGPDAALSRFGGGGRGHRHANVCRCAMRCS